MCSTKIKPDWVCRLFHELTTSQLYAILALRSEVFVVEQKCAFQDIDGLDPRCIHLLCSANDELVAYARILPEGVWGPGVVSVGRLVSSPRVRGQGLGAEAMVRALSYLQSRGNRLPIKLESQHRLERFYKRFGFESVSDPYIKDGQPHIAMVLDPTGECGAGR